ncbi:hypothetical protein BS78_05G086000 [Paspalum vaginatum]|nr:hypothetical protein BS78_05G086000 [Paspalum vaginatum]
MAMAGKLALLALMATTFLVAAHAHGLGFRTRMIRREATINFTRAAQYSRDRLSMLAAQLDAAAGGGAPVSTQTPLTSDPAHGEYNMEISIGTPPLRLLALADTGSDLIWAKCGACASCTPQGSPSYYPDMSSSFSKLPCSDQLCGVLLNQNQSSCSAGGAECDYIYRYGLSADHYTQGYLGSETFTLGGDAVQGVGFGCTTASTGNYGSGSGLVGLGRGPLSLVTQLGIGAFSYCLSRDSSKASPLLFGSLATFMGAGPVQSTPLLQGTSYYAVDLRNISIGAETGAGTGGAVFDSGTTYTFLTEPAYSEAKNAILSQLQSAGLQQVDGSSYGFEACYSASMDDISSAAPQMVLHFDGADMNLPVANYFVQPDLNQQMVCWVVQKSTTLTLIGNIMQMNYQIRHDVANSLLSFQQADCDNL